MKKTYFAPEAEVIMMTVNHQMLTGSITDLGGLDGFGDGGDVIGEPIDTGEGPIDADGRKFYWDNEDIDY